MIIEFESAHLAALQSVIPTQEDTREYLRGWYLDVSVLQIPMLVASDGSVMVTAPCHIVELGAESPVSHLFRPVKVPRYKVSRLMTFDTQTLAMIDYQGRTQPLHRINVAFPDRWRQIMVGVSRLKEDNALPAIGFNPELTARIVRALPDCTGCAYHFGVKATDPVYVRFFDYPDIRATLMPIRL